MLDVQEVTNGVMASAPSTVQHDTSNDRNQHAFQVAHFIKARTDQNGRSLPHIIAHRGYKAKFPENSLLAFGEAVKAGATALETDVRLSNDKVVVLNHDKDLKRFGHDKKISDVAWGELESMRTVEPPHVPLYRLGDLLEHLLKPEFRGIWLLLDTKSNEEPETLIHQMASTIASVRAPDDQPWKERIVLGLWAAKQLPLAATLLPGFPALNIGFSMQYSRRHFSDPNLGSLFLIESLLGFGGNNFIRDRRAMPGPTMAWTVNEQDKAEWCIRRGLDGIITDDPEFLAQVVDQFEWAPEPMIPITLKAYYDVIKVYIRVNYYFAWFKDVLKLDDGDSDDGLAENKKSR